MSSQVKAKAAQADEWIRQQAEAQAGGTRDPEPAETAEVTQILSEVDDDSEVAELEVVEQVADEVQEPQQPAEAEGISALRADLEKADARWRSLQGQVSSKDRQIEQLHALIANMQTAPDPEPEQTEQLPVGVTAADKDAFGEDMIDVIERVARQIAAQETAQLKQQVGDMSGQVENVSKHTAKTMKVTFEGELDKAVPNWRTLNESDDFLAWLKASPTRQNQWAEAVQVQDAAAVADFFQFFAKLNGLDEQHAEDTKQKRQKKLEGQLAPGKSRGGQAPVSSKPEGKNWSRTEIAAVYRQKSQYSAEEFAKLEREIAKAMQEDRVDYTT